MTTTTNHLKTDINTILATASGAGATLAAWAMQNASGLIVGVLGLGIQIYFNLKKDRREERYLKIAEEKSDAKD